MTAPLNTASLVSELRAKLDGHLPGLPRVDGPRSVQPQYALYEHELRQLLGEADRAKLRGDNHWETLRSIREIARTSGDLGRIIQWVNDAGSGYVERPEATIAGLMDQVSEATRQRDEALAALKASEERGWQPIESAPRDGTLILVPGRYGIATPACWWPAAHLEADHTLRGDWDDGERNEDGGFSPFYPTHWMPLPAAPSALENGPSDLADATKKDPGTEQREAGR